MRVVEGVPLALGVAADEGVLLCVPVDEGVAFWDGEDDELGVAALLAL